MKAADMIKSIALTDDLTSGDMMVVTQYQNQDPTTFLIDNFKCCGSKIASCNPEVKSLAILNSQDYLAVLNDKYLVSPDGKSVLVPDYTIEFDDNSHALLYKIN